MLVKILFFPLANKSYASMAKMKAVQPQMAMIKERYADDKMKQQQAMMELYKKEKINPVAGCLPIAIQIPVFFSLYKVLFVTIEMRHAPFFGWIKDLSAPDPTNIFTLFGLIPFDPTTLPVFGHFLHLGVWPLIMGVTMWMQMKLNPAPPDPTQQMIFNWMPMIFTFMLASFPAGPGDLLGLEQLAVGGAAKRHHAQERRQDRIVGQPQAHVFEEEAEAAGGIGRGLSRSSFRGREARSPESIATGQRIWIPAHGLRPCPTQTRIDEILATQRYRRRPERPHPVRRRLRAVLRRGCVLCWSATATAGSCFTPIQSPYGRALAQTAQHRHGKSQEQAPTTKQQAKKLRIAKS